MAGGVERQAISLANDMNRRGHHADLLTLDPAEAKAFYDFDPDVSWHRLDMGDPSIKANIRLRLARMKRTREIMREEKPDVILAFQQGMFLTLRLYTLGMGIPVIAAERESPFRYDFINDGKHRDLFFQSFRLAPRITVQCESYVEAYPNYLHDKIAVIPNAVFPAEKDNIADPQGKPGAKKILLCVARLAGQKNQTVLLDAFSVLSGDFPDWSLMLVGDGHDHAMIKDKIHNLGLNDKVQMQGPTQNISKIYAQAQALCIPSKWEGFPNVLAEAMAHGLPAVGYQGCGGVRDLITHGESGLLAAGNGDLETLTATLRDMLSDDDKRAEMGRKAHIAMQDFTPKHVYDQWEAFLKKVAQQQ